MAPSKHSKPTWASRLQPRLTPRASIAALAVLAAAAAAGVLAAMPSIVIVVALAGTTVLIMGGTGHSLATPPDPVQYVQRYMDDAVDGYVRPGATAISAGIPAGPYNRVAVITPEEHAPNYGTLTLRESVFRGLAALDSCVRTEICAYNPDVGSEAPSSSDSFVIFGYSQSAAIAMLEKAQLATEYAGGAGPDVSFVVIGNARPNGGLVARDTTGLVTALLMGVRRSELITDIAPADTRYETVDVAMQYDGFSDFPLNPRNLLAGLNAYMGIIVLHSTYGDHSLSEPGVIDQGQYGDTRYLLIPARVLPLLRPVESIPFVGRALADSWDPVLRVIVESAYDRSVSPGIPTAFNLSYREDPIFFVSNLVAAVPVGIDNGFEHVFGLRPLGTERPGAYGVGKADVSGPESEPDSIGEPRQAAGFAPPIPTGTELDSETVSFEGLLDSADSSGSTSESPELATSADTTSEVDTTDAESGTAESDEESETDDRTDLGPTDSASDLGGVGEGPGAGDRGERHHKPSIAAKAVS